MPLRDTLNRLREKEQQEQLDRPALIAEWQGAVEDLLAQIRNDLSEYEQDSSISIRLRRIRLNEESLGSYEISAMDIQAGRVLVLIQPVGRIVIGAEGRVDIHRQGRPSEEHRVMLLRIRPSGATSTPHWFINLPQSTVSKRSQFYTTMSQTRKIEPFSKHELERAIDMLLS